MYGIFNNPFSLPHAGALDSNDINIMIMLINLDLVDELLKVSLLLLPIGDTKRGKRTSHKEM
jgi:hypothetical protein